ncbi:MAG: hypothetical protein WBI01_09735 [Syntrophomonadaceae bacterium]
MVIMSRFALVGILEDIEVKSLEESNKNIDILLTIDSKPLYAEISRIAKNLRHPDMKVGTMSSTEQIMQVTNKIFNKVCEQLSICPGPTLLVICLPDLGANEISTRWALEDNLKNYPDVGAIIVYCRYLFRFLYWYINNSAKPTKRLDNTHISYLEGILGKPTIV